MRKLDAFDRDVGRIEIVVLIYFLIAELRAKQTLYRRLNGILVLPHREFKA